MKKTLLFLALLLSAFTFAQSSGITYQAVIYSTSGESVPGYKNANAPLVNKAICLQFSIIDDYSQIEYQEKITVSTDDFGMVNLVIGTGIQTGGFASSFETIVWNTTKKQLKVGLNQSGNCESFDEISNQVLNYVPFALAANSAASVSGIVGIANGGTNASTILGAKTNLQLQNVDNTKDLDKPISVQAQTALDTKVTKINGKELSTNDFTTVEKTKLAAITGTNTGDQDLSTFATTTTTAAALATKVDKVIGKDLSTNDFTTLEKTKLAAITGTNTGDQDLSSFATTTALAEKVDKVIGKDLSTNDFTTAEKIKLASLGGTLDLTLYARLTDLTTKVDKVTGKELSSNDYTNVEKTKLAAISGTNTGDQDLSGFVPFNGALNSVNLGNKDLSANNVYAGRLNDINIGVKGSGETNYLGTSAMAYSAGGFANTAIGHFTLTETQGDENTAVGAQAMRGSTTGAKNTALGRASLNGNLSGSNNTALGYYTGVSSPNLNNTTAIGSGAIVSSSNTIQLGNTDVTDVKTSGKLTTGAITLPNIDGTSGQVLSTNGAGIAAWTTPSTVSISSISSNSNSNGAIVNNGVLSLTPADATNGGIITSGNQTFGGDKIFNGKVNIGTGLFNSSAILNIESTTQGALLPRLTTTQRDAIQDPANGLIIYNTNNETLENYVMATNSSTEANSLDRGGWDAPVTPVLNDPFMGQRPSYSAAQSFLVTSASKLTAIQVYVVHLDLAGQFQLKLFNGVGTSGTLLSSQSLSVANAGILKINLPSAVPVSQGQTYTFELISTDGQVRIGLNDNYANGNFFQNSNTSGNDLRFILYYSSTTGSWKRQLSTSDSTLPIANGGTGSATQNFVDLTSSQTIAGIKTFSTDIIVDGLTVGNGTQASNVVVGESAMANNNSGGYSVAVGFEALKSNTDGNSNTAIGHQALVANTTGGANIAIGMNAMTSNTIGQQNLAIGQSTLAASTTASANTVVGNSAGANITTGGYNTIVGHESARGLSTGSWNTIIGRYAYTGNVSNNIIVSNGQGAIKAQHDGTDWTLTGGLTAGGITYPKVNGTSGQVLSTNGAGIASWTTPAAGGSTGVDLTTNQTIAGIKTFSTDIIVDDITIGSGAGTAANTAVGYQALLSNTSGDSNTAIGNSAMLSNTGGVRNTATGIDALRSNISGGENTASGYFSLKSNNGNKNTGTGYESLLSNTSGTRNTGLGVQGLRSNTTGSDNTATGNTALDGNTTGLSNTANGAGALFTNTTGSKNTALGFNTGYGITTGDNNTIIGANIGASPNTALAAGLSSNIILANGTGAIKAQHNGTDWTLTGGLTAGGITYPKVNGTSGQVLSTNGSGTATWTTPSGGIPYSGATAAVDLGAFDLKVNSLTFGRGLGNVSSNTAVGALSLSNNTTGYVNSAFGFNALMRNTTGANNTAIGGQALYNNTTGGANTGLGLKAMNDNTTGGGNTAVGFESLYKNISGNDNAVVGTAALHENTTGKLNTAFGINALYGNITGDNNIAIGSNAMTIGTTNLNNTAVGTEALKNQNASRNTALGYQAGLSIVSGDNNTVIGASTNVTGGSANATAVGYGAIATSSNTIQLGNSSVTDVKTSGSITAKSIISSGKTVMGTATIDYSQLNNYDVSNVSILFVRPNSSWTFIYGLSGGVLGQVIHIYSVNNQTANCCTGLTLHNFDSSSNTGTQKFVAPGNINIDSNQNTTLVFDGTYWRVTKMGM